MEWLEFYAKLKVYEFLIGWVLIAVIAVFAVVYSMWDWIAAKIKSWRNRK